MIVWTMARRRNGGGRESHLALRDAVDPYSLYLSSARCGNVFAMTALARMCDESASSRTRGTRRTARHPRLRRSAGAAGRRDDLDNPFLPTDATASSGRGGGRGRSCGGAGALALVPRRHPRRARARPVSLADDIMLRYMRDRDGMGPDEREDALC